MKLIHKVKFYIVKFKHSLWYRILKLFRIREMEKIPDWLMLVRILIYPFNTLYWWLERKEGIFDLTTDIYTLYGQTYTGQFFWCLGKYGIDTGGIFKIDRTKDGRLYITELK